MWIYIIYFYLDILKIYILGFQTIISTPSCLTAVQFKKSMNISTINVKDLFLISLLLCLMNHHILIIY